jgi:hypothetical protein
MGRPSGRSARRLDSDARVALRQARGPGSRAARRSKDLLEELRWSINELCDLSRGTVWRWALSFDYESRSPELRATERSALFSLMLFAETAEGVRTRREGRERQMATDC